MSPRAAESHPEPGYRANETFAMETMMKAAVAILAVALFFPMIAGAQSPPLAAGMRVRVTSPRDDLKKHVGTVMELRHDSIVVTGRLGPRTIALENIVALDVSLGRRTQIARSALLGFGGGALFGGILGVAAYEEPDFFFSSATQMGAVSALVFGSIGLVAGGLVGALNRADHWDPRDFSVRAAIGSSRQGAVSVGLSRSF